MVFMIIELAVSVRVYPRKYIVGDGLSNCSPDMAEIAEAHEVLTY